jgi:hypothetical protein
MPKIKTSKPHTYSIRCEHCIVYTKDSQTPQKSKWTCPKCLQDYKKRKNVPKFTQMVEKLDVYGTFLNGDCIDLVDCTDNLNMLLKTKNILEKLITAMEEDTQANKENTS